MSRSTLVLAIASLLALGAPAGAQAATESLVTVGSQSLALPFPQNKQNEPAVAVDPSNPRVVAAGANEEIDEPPCDGSDCPFVQGIGNSGVYFSFNGGASWIQPTYTGFSGRTGSLGTGPIGTLPKYAAQGLVSDGDPGVVFGPRPGVNGRFSWSNGSRLYYSNLTSNFATERSEATFRGFEAIAVSHADGVQAAAANDASTWSNPAIVTEQHQSQTTFSDKPAMTADDAASSPNFGNVYVCYSRFNGQQPDGPIKIAFSRSTDGGQSFSSPKTISTAAKIPTQDGRQGCSVATDSQGNVYVVWEDAVQKASVFKLARSTDGGRSFSTPQVVAHVSDVGVFDGVRSFSFDGIAGARTSSFPSLSIANGAPSGAHAPNTIALGWSDGADGLNHEHALVELSADGGRTWSAPQAVERSGDRPDFAFLGISPNGSDLYVVYDGFGDPFRQNTTHSRRFVGVLRRAHVSGTSLSGLTTLDRGAAGDARASSANSLVDEFIGDYNSVDATNSGAVAVFNDARDGSVCGAIDVFRQATVDGTAGAPPAPATSCQPTFGDTDIRAAVAP